ncbi:long-chain-fatty-acid--CoA ligase [Duganella sp. FT92W]|uniref:Long-chain-fatty-acid--CoA ligase n=1 Tax=Pseudoduganella rivuli TaxID=2666085 RepID=A0A7X2IIF0_9BURK|nr:3-(methylthio)propionyl-CoA ligase [Pseudoduganella rivuli]MRV70243.1 long-chain-fatty-acid--CoA ligase [Pseudoduganella rivuli]
MLGNMQHQPLLISSLITHAARCHPNGEIVSRTTEGPVHRTTYGAVARRAQQLANALARLGVREGDRIATLAWNGYRHMELYYGVSGMGAVLHTVNPRLFAEQLEYIINHAEDQYVFFDTGFTQLLEQLAPKIPGIKGFVAMTDRAHMPTSALPNLLCYEDLLAAESDDYAWPVFNENNAAALCYTSGTTGHPKGVLYSHRSSVLHAMAACTVDGMGIGAADSLLVVVPMFHVNAWGTPYAGAMCGAKLVFPGPALDGKSVYALMRDEKVSLALGVPTVWLGLFQYVEQHGLRPKEELCLRRVLIGGSAAPAAMIGTFEIAYGADVIHAWGMTELSPMGTICCLQPKHGQLDAAERMKVREKQGRAVFGIAMKIVDDDGAELPHDGKAAGRLLVRGPWVAAGYFRHEGGQAIDADGWFDTGDVANIDADGYMHITDRAKDVIKSGGEWISSIDLENAAMGHPAVAEAAVIGIAHPKWQERPLLVVVPKAGHAVSSGILLAYLEGKVAKWWLPDDVQFVDQLPHTATGKLQKLTLREMFRDYRFPN